MDAALQRLVVRGPAADVAAFRKAASSRSKPTYLTMDPVHKTQKLSFKKLSARVAPKNGSFEDLEEPWDLAVDRLERYPDGTVQLTYRFQTDLRCSDCEVLTKALSRIYPRLCFVLGSIAPCADEQISLLAYQGRIRRWRLPDKRKQVLQADIPEPTEDNDDEILWAEIEAGWAMMDAVVDHWKPAVDELMKTAASHGRRKKAVSRARL